MYAYGKAAMRQLHGTSYKVPSLEAATEENTPTHRSCQFITNSTNNQFPRRRSSLFIRLVEHLTALRSWCKQLSPVGENPTCFIPGALQGHEGLYGQTTTCMDGFENTPPPYHHGSSGPPCMPASVIAVTPCFVTATAITPMQYGKRHIWSSLPFTRGARPVCYSKRESNGRRKPEAQSCRHKNIR